MCQKFCIKMVKTGVKFINTLTLEEFIQPAEVVMLGSYVFNNANLMVSNIGEIYNPKTGKGTLGKNYSYQITPSVNGFLKDPFNLILELGHFAIGQMILMGIISIIPNLILSTVQVLDFLKTGIVLQLQTLQNLTHLHGESNLKKLLFIIILDLLILELRVHLFLIQVIIYPLIQLIKILMDYHLSA